MRGNMRLFSVRNLCVVAFMVSTCAAPLRAEDESGATRAAVRASATMVVGRNVNTSKMTGYQAEEAIAVNPTDPQKIVVFSNVSTGGIFRGYSTDGGQTWTSGVVATGKDGMD